MAYCHDIARRSEAQRLFAALTEALVLRDVSRFSWPEGLNNVQTIKVLRARASLASSLAAYRNRP
jgi:hypothetical protein